jgi:hypothetical protein
MSRKQRRLEGKTTPRRPEGKTTPRGPEGKTTPQEVRTEPLAARTLPTRRSRPLSPRGGARAEFFDESQYQHVRGELIRIAVLAFSLFATLILLRLVSSALGFLP